MPASERSRENPAAATDREHRAVHERRFISRQIGNGVAHVFPAARPRRGLRYSYARVPLRSALLSRMSPMQIALQVTPFGPSSSAIDLTSASMAAFDAA